MLRGPDASSVVVFDVRDDDYVGGHIRGGFHMKSEHFLGSGLIDAVIDEHLVKTPSVTKVVLHCMFSQQRGPQCAQRLVARLAERKIHPQPSVYVLRNGWMGFVRLFSADADLVEDVDRTMWE
ncbi:hypothetical protein FOA52_003557 [Chlamydomonas sp. UWO 241]|nr:hypothetical protein FOA52_003557 [Chlamydomonas sp. UWO 241]